MSTSFDRLLADIDRRLRRQQQAGRIPPPKVTPRPPPRADP